MPSYRVLVVRPALVRFASLLVVVVLVLFSLACGHSSSTTPTTPVGPSPTFTSTAPLIAREGVLYTYNITTTTTDGSTVTYKLTTGPEGATIDGSTLSWTPTHAESRIANSFTVTATTSNNGSFPQNFTITPNGSVDGTMINHAVSASGVKDYPVDLSSGTLQALLPNASGGYDVLKGSGDSSGNFSIPNVPPGSFWLHYAPQGYPSGTYIWTNASDVDAGSMIGYRGGGVQGTSVVINPNVNLTVAPSVPADGTDIILWKSPDIFADGSPSAYSVTQPLTTPFAQHGFLIDSSTGDRAFLVHYKISSFSADLYLQNVVESIEYDSLTETDGPVSISGTMTADGGSTTDPVVKISQFDPLLAGTQDTQYIGHQFQLFDAAYDGSEGYSSSGIPLINASTNSTADKDFGSIPYGLVTKNGAPYYVYSDAGSRIFNTNIGPFYFQVGLQNYSNVIPTASAPIVPVIGLPQSALINGLDFNADQTLSSLTPHISWNAPSLGTANYYLVSVTNISDLSTYSVYSFYTTTKSVLIPPGVLQPGTTYVVSITAASDSAVKFATAPFRQGTSPAYGTIVSGQITISGSATKPKRAQNSAAKGNVYVTLNNGRIQIERK